MYKVWETDWLASKTIFYNEKSRKVSLNINNVINYNDIEIDPEGFNNYLKFGYSILGQTPIKNVKFFRHNTKIWVDENNKIIDFKELEDPVHKWFVNNRIDNENDVINLISSKLNNWILENNSDIVVPSSGGYDSRLINYLIKNKERVFDYSFGVSTKQNKSCEAVYAKKVAELLGLNWRFIYLGNFNSYISEWDKLYGPSIHAHGMYQMEFHEKIMNDFPSKKLSLISGIIGDLWAGSVPKQNIKNHEDIQKLSFTHGMSADVSQSKLKSDSKLLKDFWSRSYKELNDWRYQIITLVRFKIILLNYLMKIPDYYGFNSYSPYLDMDVALSMLNLPSERRQNRKWQKEYFRKVGLDLEKNDLNCSKANTLNLQAIDNYPPFPLDEKIMSEVINESYIRWINSQLLKKSFFNRLKYKNFPQLIRLESRLNLNSKLKAYYAYLVLRPIENVLKKRNEYS